MSLPDRQDHLLSFHTRGVCQPWVWGASVCPSIGAVLLNWRTGVLLACLLAWISLLSYPSLYSLPPSDSYLCGLTLPPSSNLFRQSMSQCMCLMPAFCFLLSISKYLCCCFRCCHTELLASNFLLLPTQSCVCKHEWVVWNFGVLRALSRCLCVFLNGVFPFP